MDFTILYTYEKDCGMKYYVVLKRKGRIYTRPCKLDGLNHPVFRFMGRTWTPDIRIQLFPDTL